MKTVKYDNINFFIGENAVENWNLLDTSKNINNHYIWFHLNSFPSPYVIMQSSIIELKEQYNNNELNNILNFAANLCKENSKYKYLNNLKIIYTSLNKLEKGDKIGEVIIKGRKNIIKL